MNTEDAKKALKLLAKMQGISVEEIRREIEIAIADARTSKDPKVQAYWNSIPYKGEFPTPEEVITYIAGRIK